MAQGVLSQVGQSDQMFSVHRRHLEGFGVSTEVVTTIEGAWAASTTGKWAGFLWRCTDKGTFLST